MSSKIDKGIAASVVAPFFIALSILLSKIAGQHCQALFVAGLGSLVSVPILWLAAVLGRSNLGLNILWTRTRTTFLQVVVTRAIFGQALIILGFTMTSAVKSILLLRVEPVFVFLWSMLLLKEKPAPGEVALLCVLVAGSVLVVWPGDKLSAPNLGDGLIVLSLLFLSYSYIPTRKVVEQAPVNGLNLLTNLFGGLAITIAAIAYYGIASIPASPNAWGPIAGYSLSFFVAGASLYFYAFRTVKPWIISSLLSLEVVYGLVLAAMMMSEKLTLLQLCGTVILLAATVVIALYHKRNEQASGG
jgi:drug/metabolite transporter (DMT)-like permease